MVVCFFFWRRLCKHVHDPVASWEWLARAPCGSPFCWRLTLFGDLLGVISQHGRGPMPPLPFVSATVWRFLWAVNKARCLVKIARPGVGGFDSHKASAHFFGRLSCDFKRGIDWSSWNLLKALRKIAEWRGSNQPRCVTRRRPGEKKRVLEKNW